MTNCIDGITQNFGLTGGHDGSAAFLSLGGVICTAILALLGVWMTNQFNDRAKLWEDNRRDQEIKLNKERGDQEMALKHQELFQQALGWLTGESQKRSVGIAIVKALADKNGMTDVAKTIFVAQMLHLRDGAYGKGSSARQIEEFNFYVMKDALNEWKWPSLGADADQVANQLTGMSLPDPVIRLSRTGV